MATRMVSSMTAAPKRKPGWVSARWRITIRGDGASTSNAAPVRAMGLSARSRSIVVMAMLSPDPNSRIEIRVDHVGEKREEDIGKGDENHDRLHDREIRPQDRLKGEEADPVQREYGL